MPVGIRVVLALGGIYTGLSYFCAEEAGANGSAGALAIGVLKRWLSWEGFWRVLVETGQIAAANLFLIITASMYRRMHSVAALPTVVSDWLTMMKMGMAGLMTIYVVLKWACSAPSIETA